MGKAVAGGAGLSPLFVRLLPIFGDGKHFFGVAVGSDLGKYVEQSAVGADQKRGPLDSHDFLAIHVLFFQHAKLFAHFFRLHQQGVDTEGHILP